MLVHSFRLPGIQPTLYSVFVGPFGERDRIHANAALERQQVACFGFTAHFAEDCK